MRIERYTPIISVQLPDTLLDFETEIVADVSAEIMAEALDVDASDLVDGLLTALKRKRGELEQ